MINYPSNWNQIIKLVKKRDNYTCQSCKKTFPACSTFLQVHHILELSKGGSNEPSNLVTLCKLCHTQKHEHLRVRYTDYKKFKPLKR